MSWSVTPASTQTLTEGEQEKSILLDSVIVESVVIAVLLLVVVVLVGCRIYKKNKVGHFQG